MSIRKFTATAVAAVALTASLTPTANATPFPELDPMLARLLNPAAGSAPYIEADSPAQADEIVQRIRSAADPTAEAAAIRVNYGPCVLEPRNIHFRTRSGESKNIGFKPITRCSHPVTSINHESKLKYKYYFWWRDAQLYGGVPTRKSNRGAKTLEQRNVQFFCRGDVQTTFSGVTQGRIVSGGKTYYATVYPNHARLNCRA